MAGNGILRLFCKVPRVVMFQSAGCLITESMMPKSELIHIVASYPTRMNVFFKFLHCHLLTSLQA